MWFFPQLVAALYEVTSPWFPFGQALSWTLLGESIPFAAGKAEGFVLSLCNAHNSCARAGWALQSPVFAIAAWRCISKPKSPWFYFSFILTQPSWHQWWDKVLGQKSKVLIHTHKHIYISRSVICVFSSSVHIRRTEQCNNPGTEIDFKVYPNFVHPNSVCNLILHSFAPLKTQSCPSFTYHAFHLLLICLCKGEMLSEKESSLWKL